ncbi:MAG TPA: hypothetical protein VMR34_02015 [Candidatus Saccharimonadales bacterium]|nr:hypothetical protein [Candidatus Saccharimonadales bacterium]
MSIESSNIYVNTGVDHDILTSAPPSTVNGQETCYVGCTPTPTTPSSPVIEIPPVVTMHTEVGHESNLPFTGADVYEMGMIGVGLIGIGVAARMVSRHRRHSVEQS